MPLVEAKCTNCGAALQVDDQKDAAVCQYCNSAFIVEKAIQNYEIHNSYKIENANIIIHDEKSVENRLAAADKYMNQLKEYDQAYGIYAEVEKYAPDNYRVWYGKIASGTEGFNVGLTAGKIVNNRGYYKSLERDIANAYTTAPAEEKTEFCRQITTFLESCNTALDEVVCDCVTEKGRAAEQELLERSDAEAVKKSIKDIDKNIRKMNSQISVFEVLDKVVGVFLKISLVTGFFATFVGIIGAFLTVLGSRDYALMTVFLLFIGIAPTVTLFILHKFFQIKSSYNRKKINKENFRKSATSRDAFSKEEQARTSGQRVQNVQSRIDEYRMHMKNIEATIQKYRV